MPDRDLVWNPERGRYEWAIVRYDYNSDQQIVEFAEGQMALDRSAIQVNYGARYLCAEAAVALTENLATRGIAFPMPPFSEIAISRPKRRHGWWALARRILRRLLRRYRPKPAARPVRAGVIHRMGFGGLRA